MTGDFGSCGFCASHCSVTCTLIGLRALALGRYSILSIPTLHTDRLIAGEKHKADN